MSFLPSFVRRRMLLARARERLAAGDPRGALSVLADPACAGSQAAADLIRAAELHLASLPKDGPSAAIRDLLAEMRAERLAREGKKAPPPASDTTSDAADETPRVARHSRWRMAVDDAGEYLVVVGSDFVVGHAASRRADLPFLADLGGEHARLVLVSDFRAGTRWRLVPLGRGTITVAGRTVGPAGVDLHDGDRVALASNLTLRFHAPDSSSASAVLELLHGVECLGAARVLLFAPGAEGRVRVGPTLARLVRVASLEHDVALEITPIAPPIAAPPIGLPHGAPEELAVLCAGGVGRGSRPTDSDPREARVALPPAASERVTLGARARDRAPFEIVFLPDPELGGVRA